MKVQWLRPALLCLALFTGMTFAQDSDEASADISYESSEDVSETEAATAEDPFSELGLHPETGKIDIAGGVAALDLTDDFVFLNGKDADKLLQSWGNPPDSSVKGMIYPISEEGQALGYVVVVTYEEDGHVKDSDAKDIDYADLLKDMIESSQEANKERIKAGYGSMELLDWAEQPYYDQADHKLYWALDYKTDEGNTLNYNIRVLGRKGVLVLNVVSSTDKLPLLRQPMKDVMAMASFTPGNTYGDFDSSMDKVAEYTIAGLIAGAALKGGLWKVLIGALLAGKKLILVAIVAIGGLIAKLRGKSGEQA